MVVEGGGAGVRDLGEQVPGGGHGLVERREVPANEASAKEQLVEWRSPMSYRERGADKRGAEQRGPE